MIQLSQPGSCELKQCSHPRSIHVNCDLEKTSGGSFDRNFDEPQKTGEVQFGPHTSRMHIGRTGRHGVHHQHFSEPATYSSQGYGTTVRDLPS